MKYLKLGGLLALLLAAYGGQAQGLGVRVGPKAGLALNLLSGQINRSAQFKPGLLLGGVVRWRFSERLALQPELEFVQQGTHNQLNFGSYPATNDIRLNYLNLPVLVKVYLGPNFNFQAGPQLGLLLSGRRTGQTGYYSGNGGNYYTTEDVDVSDSYSSDLALVAGVGFDLANGLQANARVNYGVTDINNDAKDKAARQALGLGGLYNRGLEVSLSYLIGARR